MYRARCEGPRTQSRTTDANLDCVFVENALVFVVPNIGRAWAPLYDPLEVFVSIGNKFEKKTLKERNIYWRPFKNRHFPFKPVHFLFDKQLCLLRWQINKFMKTFKKVTLLCF